jgi:hypothetical protein
MYFYIQQVDQAENILWVNVTFLRPYDKGFNISSQPHYKLLQIILTGGLWYIVVLILGINTDKISTNSVLLILLPATK